MHGIWSTWSSGFPLPSEASLQILFPLYSPFLSLIQPRLDLPWLRTTQNSWFPCLRLRSVGITSISVRLAIRPWKEINWHYLSQTLQVPVLNLCIYPYTFYITISVPIFCILLCNDFLIAHVPIVAHKLQCPKEQWPYLWCHNLFFVSSTVDGTW